MNLETLEFVIYPDGRVLEKVTGITGSSCAEVTAKIEAELGVVVSQETSSEYYAQQLVQTETATQSTFSNW
jgi:fructose/tagatose bisphosphate aldolase